MGGPDSRGGRGRSLQALLLVLLLTLSVAAFAGTRALRSEADIVNSVVVTPELDPATGERASIRFRLTRADDRASVLVIADDGSRARSLASDVRLEAGPHAYRWDGRSDSGGPVAAGEYRLRVVLAEQGREIEPPGTIEVGG